MQGHNRNWVRLARVGKGAALSQAIGAEKQTIHMLGLVAVGAREQIEARADCDAVTYSDSLKTVKLSSTQPAATSLILLVEESGKSPIATSSMHLRKNSAPSSGRP